MASPTASGRQAQEVWINVEQKVKVHWQPPQYSTFLNQSVKDINPFDTTPMTMPKTRPRHDIIKVHDSGVVLQLSEISSEPTKPDSDTSRPNIPKPVQGHGQGQSQGQPQGQGQDIADDWEVVYPDE